MSGLFSDESLSNHLVSHGLNVLLSDQMHSALVAVGMEATLATASGKDLGFNHYLV
jgi:glycerol dehydrogenase-like iron-containing ADH family enzyme